MKIMFYCQYLAGMGHLVRSTEIIRSLVKEFQVCLVNGGQPIVGFKFPAGVEVVELPALLEEAGELKAVEHSQNIDAVKERRTQILLNVFDRFRPDCLITECFPFSKHKVKFELLPLLDRARARPVKVVCSLRDLIMTQPRTPEATAKRCEKVCDLIDRYYDLVLVHGDPNLQQLDSFFPKVNDLNCEVYYTGYVAQSAPDTTSRTVPMAIEDQLALSQNTPMIVSSVGGGRFGYELLNAVVSASVILESVIPHQIYAFTGPFMPDQQVSQLERSIANQKVNQKNIILRRYTPHLLEYLNKAELSISLGGYNTTMNILKTGVRALVYPAASEEQTGEQTSRAAMLAQKNVLELLYTEDLVGDRLAQRILDSLDRAPAAHAFDLQGAERSALRLKQLLYSSVMAV